MITMTIVLEDDKEGSVYIIRNTKKSAHTPDEEETFRAIEDKMKTIIENICGEKETVSPMAS